MLASVAAQLPPPPVLLLLGEIGREKRERERVRVRVREEGYLGLR